MKIIDRFKDNIELNEDVSYIASVEIHHTPVNIYISDYGQCYFFTFINKNNEIEELSCGSYNTDYLMSICSHLDYKGMAISLFGKDYGDQTTHDLIDRWTERGWKEKNLKEFEEMLEKRNQTDYEIYNLEEMYKMLEER